VRLHEKVDAKELRNRPPSGVSGAPPRLPVYFSASAPGPFEDDPSVTNKRFPGNPTKSYRSIHPLRVVAEVEDWEPSDPALVKGMPGSLEKMRQQGMQDLIDD
jgi:hypothetical protein